MDETFVATLVAGGGLEFLSPIVESVVTKLSKPRLSWLSEDHAVDVFSDNLSELTNLLRVGIADHKIDCIIQPVKSRRKRVLVADMESTIIEQEMLDELADSIGIRDKVANITARAMNGELDFATALNERVGLLKGLPVKVLKDAAERITFMSGAIELIQTLRDNGCRTWLVSGGFTFFAVPVAEQLGFDRVFANELIIADGKLTGEVAQPIIDKNSKEKLLNEACQSLAIPLEFASAVGDGANDVPMLSACNQAGGLGFAFHAKPNVRSVVPHQINHTDLRTILYAEGYREVDFTSSSRR